MLDQLLFRIRNLIFINWSSGKMNFKRIDRVPEIDFLYYCNHELFGCPLKYQCYYYYVCDICSGKGGWGRVNKSWFISSGLIIKASGNLNTIGETDSDVLARTPLMSEAGPTGIWVSHVAHVMVRGRGTKLGKRLGWSCSMIHIFNESYLKCMSLV